MKYMVSVDVFLGVIICVAIVCLMITICLLAHNLWRIYPTIEGKIVGVSVVEICTTQYKYIIDFEYEDDLMIRCARIDDRIYTKSSGTTKYETGDRIIVHRNPITGGFMSKEFVDIEYNNITALATAVFATIASMMFIFDVREWIAIKNRDMISMVSNVVLGNIIVKSCLVLVGRYIVSAFAKIINNISNKRMINSTKYETVVGTYAGYDLKEYRRRKITYDGKYHYYKYVWRGMKYVVAEKIRKLEEGLKERTVYVNPRNHIAEVENYRAKDYAKAILHIIIACVYLGISCYFIIRFDF